MSKSTTKNKPRKPVVFFRYIKPKPITVVIGTVWNSGECYVFIGSTVPEVEKKIARYCRSMAAPQKPTNHKTMSDTEWIDWYFSAFFYDHFQITNHRLKERTKE